LQLLQADLRDLRLLGGGDAELRLPVVVDAGLQEREHLVGALSGRADDEDEAETLLVGEISVAQRGQGLGARAARSGLLPRRPAARAREALLELLHARADARMMGERLEDVGLLHRRPHLVGRAHQRLVGAEGPPREHPADPAARAAAASERLSRIALAHRVELRRRAHKLASRWPQTRSRLTPPSG